MGYTAYALATFLPRSESENAELTLDIESENVWEATSDWNEDDVEAVMEEEVVLPTFKGEGEGVAKVKGMERKIWRRANGSVVGR